MSPEAEKDADKRAAAKKAGSGTSPAAKKPATTKPAGKKTEKKSLPERLYTGNLAIDFIRTRKTWYIVSAVILIICIGALLLRGLNLGIEFRGGADFQMTVASANEDVQTEVREALQSSGVPDLGSSTIQVLGENRLRVQTRDLNVDELAVVRGTLAETLGISEESIDYGFVGASWGGALTQRALLAVVIFLAVVSVVIGVYFRNWQMAAAAILALVHDIVVTVGVYALVGFTVTPSTVIAILTILGYSIYDTVVVFDRVKENAGKVPASKFASAANSAVNQVIIRSINTTIVGVLPVAAVLFAGWFYLGIGPLKDLGLAMLVGMIVGAYSSLFIATPLLVDMQKGGGRAKAEEKRRARKAAAAPKPKVVVATGAGVTDEIVAGDVDDADDTDADPAMPPATAKPKTSAEKDDAAARRKKAADARADRRQRRADARDDTDDADDDTSASRPRTKSAGTKSAGTKSGGTGSGTRSQPRRRPRRDRT